MNCPICHAKIVGEERLICEKVEGKEYFITLHLKPLNETGRKTPCFEGRYGNYDYYCASAAIDIGTIAN